MLSPHLTCLPGRVWQLNPPLNDLIESSRFQTGKNNSRTSFHTNPDRALRPSITALIAVPNSTVLTRLSHAVLATSSPIFAEAKLISQHHSLLAHPRPES